MIEYDKATIDLAREQMAQIKGSREAPQSVVCLKDNTLVIGQGVNFIAIEDLREVRHLHEMCAELLRRRA